MRKIKISALPIIIIGIFILCFIIGKLIATRNTKEYSQNKPDFQPTHNLTSPASSKSEKIKKVELIEETEIYDSNVQATEESNIPPDRMLFPCGQKILNEYSQEAGYSKTMEDWRTHTGVDYEAAMGEAVLSVWDGSVQRVYRDMLWGYCVEILHDGEIISKYKNLDKHILIKEGDSVKGGQAIGKIGNSAIIEIREKPHLHFELWTGGETINPTSYIY